MFAKSYHKFQKLWVYWIVFVLWQAVYKYCDNFINKPASLNFVSQLIQRIYHTGTTWFYRLAYGIVAQAQKSFIERLAHSLSFYLRITLVEYPTERYAVLFDFFFYCLDLHQVNKTLLKLIFTVFFYSVYLLILSTLRK